MGALVALLAVVIAGLAIIAAFTTVEFVRVLQLTETGVEGDLRPFWYITALAVVGLVSSASSILLTAQAVECRVILDVTPSFAGYAFFAALNLVGLIPQGIKRAEELHNNETDLCSSLA